MTPRLNPDVNSYWMCDIGRFDYHWVEGETRLRRPLTRSRTMLEPTAWHDVEPKLRDAIQSAGSADSGSVRFLVSAHAATEELFVLKQMVEGLLGGDGLSSVTMTWNRSAKPQPDGVKFTISATDAPNVNGAGDLGFAVGSGNHGPADLSGLRTAVEGGRVKVLYVIDPGPDGSIGDVSWVISARRSGALPVLVVQGVVMTELASAADVVLPGAAWVEKDALYTNDQGRVQVASQAINPPGEAREDWQILTNLARSLGVSVPYQSSNDVRAAIAAAMPGSKYGEASKLAFARPVSAANWLQASNPSERWKWDFLYQDLPPVKGHNVQMEGAGPSPSYIPLKPVE
jgi:predicted molibdopterin-dependent oxidoreductase YjgC